MKIGKALLSWLLTAILVLTPFSSVIVFAADNGVDALSADTPEIDINIDNLSYVTADTAISVAYSATGDATLSACDTRLEGTTLSTDAAFTFTPADQSLQNGAYTLVAEATDSNGNTAIEVVTFYVVDKLDIGFSYAEDESIIPNDPDATAAYHEVTPLDYTIGYGATNDGNVAVDDALAYDDFSAIGMQYYNTPIEFTSVSGIPYQIFTIALNGKTDGEVIVRYTGATLAAERIAVKVYNPTASAWDTIATFLGSDSLSEAVDVATYACDDAVYVMATLDYVTNGSDTMIWSTDPQHYTKFEDLHDFYYQVYQFAAEKYQNGEAGYIMTTGDLVDDRPSASVAPAQWQVSDTAMEYVDAVGMPNGLVSGNHDVGDYKKPDYADGAPGVDYSMFWNTFPASRYNTKPWFGGSLNNNASHYDLVTIGNIDFVVLYLGYGVEATDETIVWANDVLSTYSHRTAIITTHQYLDAGAAVRDDTSRAQLIFDKIIDPNPNVKMILCGHDDGSLCLEKTASDGRVVYEILSDYQFVEAEPDDFYQNPHYIGKVAECCGDGYIRLMSVEGNKLSSTTYSPVTGRYNPYGYRENFTIDLGDTTPTRPLSTVGFSAYVLGEETTDTLSSDTALVITGQNSTSYHHVSYMNYPDLPDSAGNTPVDLAALAELITTAKAIDTEGCTAESVAALTDALDAAVIIDTTSVDDIQKAYVAISNAIGGLEDIKETIDPSTLESIHVYDMTLSKWYSNDSGTVITSSASHIAATQTEKGGIHMERSLSSTHTWPSARYNGGTITLKPNNGKIYVNLDVVANSAWCIYLEASQNGASAAVRLNFAISGAFNRIDTDGYQGTYQGVYDVTDAFVQNGFDPNATITVSRSLVYIVPGDVTYDYIELMTDPASGVADTSALEALIASAEALDKTLYTTSTWNNLEKAIKEAKKSVNNATVVQADVNLAVMKLQKAIDSLKLLSDVVEEPEGSLLPADEGLWAHSATNALNIYRDENNYTVIQNTNGQWPHATYTLPETYTVTVPDHQLSVDITVGSETHPHVMFNNKWVSLSKYISATNINSAGDLGAGTYTVDIPLSSIAELAGCETANIDAVRIYSVGAASASAVTVRKLMITDYEAPPESEKNRVDFLPASDDEVSVVINNGTHTVALDGTLTINATDGYRVQILKEEPTLFDLSTLNAIHMAVESDVPFKVAFELKEFTDPSVAASWLTTSAAYYGKYFTVENDRVAAGTYDVYLEAADNATTIKDKTLVYMNSVTIVFEGEGNFVISTLEAVAHDTYEWDESITYGEPATPDKPYFQHAAKVAPEVEHKVDILSAIGLSEHPTVTGWVSYGNQALGLKLDLATTPYLYYSIAQPADSNFTFGIYNNNTNAPWFLFRDGTGEGAYLNQGAANWDAYQNREQYILTSETGCIDMRQFLKNPASTSWTVNNVTFYNSQGKNVVISYLFFGSEPLAPPEPTLGDVNEDLSLSMKDAMTLFEVTSGNAPLDSVDAKLADINGDGVINTFDTLLLYNVVSGNMKLEDIV